jgi:hypothetical protein
MLSKSFLGWAPLGSPSTTRNQKYASALSLGWLHLRQEGPSEYLAVPAGNGVFGNGTVPGGLCLSSTEDRHTPPGQVASDESYLHR